MRLLGVMDAAVDDPERRPIFVEKASEIPTYYPVTALAGLFSAVAADDPVPGIIQAYVPLDMMRMGRVRAALGIIAERVAGTEADLTLAAWARKALTEPDADLAEWIVLGGTDVADLVAEIDADPKAFSARVFGEYVDARPGAEDTEILMRIGTARTRLLETDPTEGDAEQAVADNVDDEATDDPMADAFVTPLDGSDALTEGESEDGPSADELLFDYVVAYTKTHLSPVVARGIRAYRSQGSLSMAQEFKVTKAPTKTLAALFRFAETRARIGVLTYDGFAMWENVPADLRMKIVSTLLQLRWALKSEAVIVLIGAKGQAPEIEEAFSSAVRVSWRFEELPAVENEGAPFDAQIVRGWAESSSTSAGVPTWLDALIAAVPEDASMDDACAALGRVVAEAAEVGVEPSADKLAPALESIRQESPA